MTIQWFPGHMAKTRKLISENLKMVDVVIELLDARIPASSKNPEIDTLIKNKPKVIAFNKSDLADNKLSTAWSEFYQSQGHSVVLINSIKGTGINQLKSKLQELMKDKLENEKSKGIVYRPIRTMILGIPNVGKSSLINRIAGRSKAETGDRPGVTRQKQWIRMGQGIEMLDMPGILWPKFDDEKVGYKLAITGAIRDEILDIIEVAAVLMDYLKANYPDLLKKRYNLDLLDSFSKGYEILEAAGKKRGCLVSGGEVDYNRIAAIVLDEFRGGKIGKITLDEII
jgi:ribosome biogenesis GTPase A